MWYQRQNHDLTLVLKPGRVSVFQETLKMSISGHDPFGVWISRLDGHRNRYFKKIFHLGRCCGTVLSHHILYPTSYNRVSGNLLLIQFPANVHPVRQQMMAEVPGSLPPTWETYNIVPGYWPHTGLAPSIVGIGSESAYGRYYSHTHSVSLSYQ